MARNLKSNLKELQQVFAKDRGSFRIVHASADELKCKFYLKNETFFYIQGHIPDTYPSDPPLWLVDYDAASTENEALNGLDEALEPLHDTKGTDNHIINQVKMLVHLLCRTFDEPLPEKLDRLSISNDQESSVDATHSDSDKDTGMGSDDELEDTTETDEEQEENLEFDEEYELYDDDTPNQTDAGHAAIIKKYQGKMYNQHQQQSSNTNSTNKILLKEIDTIFKSDVFKNKTYSVELVDDSLYTWKVNLLSVCSDSLLHEDLNRLKAEGLKDSIEMIIMFKETFPFDPPFIQVTYPAINGGHVLEAGALCMELLTKQGWSSAYSMENVLMQISSTFITGNARVNFELTKVILNKPHSLENAKRMFAYHEAHHAKNGWFTPAGQENS